MAKRIADKELTDRNWDQEDEGEEAGTFSVASEDVLKNRPIKKAKRRGAAGEGESAGAFKGFKGFAAMSTNTTGGAATAFSGFGNGTAPAFKGFSSMTNGNSTAPLFSVFSSPASTVSATPGLTFNGPASSKPTADITSKQTNGSTPSLTQSLGSSSSSISSNKEYSRQLTALNCSVRDWITKHVNDNPLCDLNPIFRDYEQHLASIEKKYGGSAAAAAGGAAAAASAAALDGSTESSSKASGEKQGGSLPTATALSFSSGSAPPFSFGKDKDGSAPEKSSSGSSAPVPAGVTFNFGQKVDTSVLANLGSGGAPAGFSFSSNPSGQASSLFGSPPGTAVPSAAPFSFSGAKAEAVQSTDENGEEESDEPPKVEVREIKEKDAFYSKKCKLFYKKDSEFKEKGVGTLHMKQTPEGKTQIIVRADTNLGNILLNIILQASMPCSRTGKNNVMVVCVPNPPVDDKNPTSPVTMLVRVKTSQDADELHKLLEEKKL